MNKLRLLVTRQCSRNCVGCCNNDWDLDDLPVFSLSNTIKYDEILLTGGEPLEHFDIIRSLIPDLRKHNQSVRIYIYTARISNMLILLEAFEISDGLTITLHTQKDANWFTKIYPMFPSWVLSKSNRLNVFDGISVGDFEGFRIKDNIRWIKDCPLPDNEVLMKLSEDV